MNLITRCLLWLSFSFILVGCNIANNHIRVFSLNAKIGIDDNKISAENEK